MFLNATIYVKKIGKSALGRLSLRIGLLFEMRMTGQSHNVSNAVYTRAHDLTAIPLFIKILKNSNGWEEVDTSDSTAMAANVLSTLLQRNPS